jgi:hypothetical protein
MADLRHAPDKTVKRRAKKGEARCASCKHYQGGSVVRGRALRPFCCLNTLDCRADDAACSLLRLARPAVGTTVMACIKHPPDRNGTVYDTFYPSPEVVRMAHKPGPGEAIIRVRVRKVEGDEKPDGWGWWDFENGPTDGGREPCFEFVWPAKFLLDMCFPAGTKGEEERGRGTAVPIKVEEIPDTEVTP